ncbi:hypothetical protein QE373_001077 [Stenotrophomonas sp. SORGH_AS321]|nr:hypothetical protein [Stenotrophomonas sp. SORGH_AS_0321]
MGGATHYGWPWAGQPVSRQKYARMPNATPRPGSGA